MFSTEAMHDIVAAIVENADEIREKPDLDDQDFGQLLAFAESLSIIRDSCDSDDLALIGLDFDIDKRYLL